jgi:hypothetical protein
MAAVWPTPPRNTTRLLTFGPRLRSPAVGTVVFKELWAWPQAALRPQSTQLPHTLLPPWQVLEDPKLSCDSSFTSPSAFLLALPSLPSRPAIDGFAGGIAAFWYFLLTREHMIYTP